MVAEEDQPAEALRLGTLVLRWMRRVETLETGPPRFADPLHHIRPYSMDTMDPNYERIVSQSSMEPLLSSFSDQQQFVLSHDGTLSHSPCPVREPHMSENQSGDVEAAAVTANSNTNDGVLEQVVPMIHRHWPNLLLLVLGLVTVVWVEQWATRHGSPQLDRYAQLLTTAKALSPHTNWNDFTNPEYQALEWLLKDNNLLLPEGGVSTWNSAVGMAYAMFLVRYHLGYHDWKLEDGVAGMCSAWPRVRCNTHGHVTQLVFNHANLTGVVATEMGGLIHLEHLLLNTNHNLGGTLPSELGSLEKLRTLHVQQTRLSGTVPSQLGHLRDLEQFILYDTKLSGMFPPEICDLRSSGALEDLVVSCYSNLECPCASHCKKIPE